jgi:CDP-6-deoxy-D-xylo-4-hexulose-3-dehydrase
MKNLVPVIVDSKIGTYNIDIDLIKGAITPKTVALMVPHAVGSINDMIRLREICDENKLKLIEDSCDTHGSRFNGKPTGQWSDITTTSFYASHNMTAGGGGGMVMMDKIEDYRRAKIFRDWGRALPERFEHYEGAFEERYNFQLDGIDYDGKFVSMELGYNMKAVEMQAAFGLAQLDRLSGFNKIRRKNFESIFEFVKKYEKFFVVPQELPGAEAYWLSFPVTIKEEMGIVRKALLRFLEENKIQTSLLFAGNILRHPTYKKISDKFRVMGDLKNADNSMRNTFLVAAHHGLNDEMIKYLTGKIEEFLQNKGLVS